MTDSEHRGSLLTTDEASALLRCSGRTLERWRTSGGGPRYIKAGPGAKSRVFYAREDIEDWMQRKTAEIPSVASCTRGEACCNGLGSHRE
jgi:predicted DNA-binding transcriptional regulator AlpA